VVDKNLIFYVSSCDKKEETPQRGHGRHDANGSVIRWCSADAAVAKSFETMFAIPDGHK
jgi:hypothetical protein